MVSEDFDRKLEEELQEAGEQSRAKKEAEDSAANRRREEEVRQQQHHEELEDIVSGFAEKEIRAIANKIIQKIPAGTRIDLTKNTTPDGRHGVDINWGSVSLSITAAVTEGSIDAHVDAQCNGASLYGENRQFPANDFQSEALEWYEKHSRKAAATIRREAADELPKPGVTYSGKAGRSG